MATATTAGRTAAPRLAQGLFAPCTRAVRHAHGRDHQRVGRESCAAQSGQVGGAPIAGPRAGTKCTAQLLTSVSVPRRT
jgi:hypothetical protein